ncbi:hypothetical protein L9F63_009073, partial [Diploptera punctata]
ANLKKIDDRGKRFGQVSVKYPKREVSELDSLSEEEDAMETAGERDEDLQEREEEDNVSDESGYAELMDIKQPEFSVPTGVIFSRQYRIKENYKSNFELFLTSETEKNENINKRSEGKETHSSRRRFPSSDDESSM